MHNLRPLAELAKKYGYTRDHLAFLCRTGEIAAQRVGRSWQATLEAVAAYKAAMEAVQGARFEEMSARQSLVEKNVIARSPDPDRDDEAIPVGDLSRRMTGLPRPEYRPRNDREIWRTNPLDRFHAHWSGAEARTTVLGGGLDSALQSFQTAVRITIGIPVRVVMWSANHGLRVVHFVFTAPVTVFHGLPRIIRLAARPVHETYHGQISIFQHVREAARARAAVQAGIGVFIAVVGAVTAGSVMGVSGGEMGRYLASRTREAIPAQVPAPPDRGEGIHTEPDSRPPIAVEGKFRGNDDFAAPVKPRMSPAVAGITVREPIDRLAARVKNYFAGLLDEWTALVRSRWTGEFVVIERTPSQSPPIPDQVGAGGEKERVIREIVLRDVQVIERAVPGPVGPVGPAGRDGQDGVSPLPDNNSSPPEGGGKVGVTPEPAVAGYASTYPTGQLYTSPVTTPAVYYVAPAATISQGAGSAGSTRYFSAGAAVIDEVLKVGGTDQTTISGASLSNNSIGTGTLTFTSATSTDSLRVGGLLTTGGSAGIAVPAGTVPTSTLVVRGSGNFETNLRAGGALTVAGAATSTLADGLTVDTNTLVVNANENRVGIGTASPSTTLGVVGTFRVNGASTLAGDVTVSANLTVTGNATTTGGFSLTKAPTAAHTFSSWATGVANSQVLNASLVVNPASATADANLLGLAVGDAVRLLVDAEGDVFVNSLTSAGSVNVGATTVSTLTVENNSFLGDATGDRAYVSGRISIGTETGTALISASSTSATLPTAQFAGAGGQSANLLQFTNSSGAFLSGFTASGNLLINTASTSALVIQNGSGTNQFVVDSTTGNVTIAGGSTFHSATTTDSLRVGGLFTTAGNVGIKLSSTDAPTSTLSVRGSGNIETNLRIGGTLTLPLLTGTLFGNGTSAVTATTTLAVNNGGTGAGTFTANGILYGNGTSPILATSAAASSILVTNASNVPSLATDIPTAVTIGGQYVYRVGGTDVAVADGGTGASTLSAGDILLGNGTAAITATSTLAVNKGGTGAATFTLGGFLLGGGTSPITASSALTGLIYGNGTAAPTATTTLAVNVGGTGAGTFTANGILYGNGTSPILATSAAASSILVTNASNVPSLATDIPTAVTIGGQYVYRVGGTDVAVADGGTGASTLSAGDILLGNGTAAITATSTLAVNKGGTGAATFTLGGFLLGGGTSPITASSALTGLIHGNGTTAPTATTTLAVNVGGTGAGTFTTNGILYGNGTSAILATSEGGANTILTANAGAPAFSASPTIGTSVTTPLVIGGTAANSTLALRSTSGVGTSDALIFQVGNNGATEALRILSGGNVGVGTAIPGAFIHATNGTTTAPILYARAAAAVTSLTSNPGGLTANGIFDFEAVAGANTQPVLYVNASSTQPALYVTQPSTSNSAYPAAVFMNGNVGIGTTGPASRLDIKSSGTDTTPLRVTGSGDADFLFRVNEDTASGDASLYLYKDATSGTNTQTVQIHSDGTSYFNGGNVGIGTTGPTYKLDILSGTANTGTGFYGAGTAALAITDADIGLTTGNANLIITTNSAFGADKGGSIGLGGRATTGLTTDSPFAKIKGAKESGTSANLNGYLAFATYNHNAGALGERMRIDSSGNVGIGTTGPTGHLTVSGATNNWAGAGIRLIGTGTGARDWGWFVDTDSSLVLADNDGGRRVVQYYSSGNVVLAQSAGNVGIGTTIPGAFIHATNGTTTAPVLYARASAAVTALSSNPGGNTANGIFDFEAVAGANTQPVLYVNASSTQPALYVTQPSTSNSAYAAAAFMNGNVGIGTTGPSAPLQITRTFSNTGTIDANPAHLLIVNDQAAQTAGLSVGVKLYLANGIANGFGGIFLVQQGSGRGELVLAYPNSGNGNTTEGLRINSAGNVGIGTTSPTSTTDIIGSFAIRATTSYDRMVVVNTSGNTGFRTLAAATANTLCYDTSTISGLNTLSTCSSSIRYKEEVKDLVVDKDKVFALRPVDFKWKGRDERGVGLIAEEVSELIPELNTYYQGQIEGVRYGELAVYLLPIIKELDARVMKFAASNQWQLDTDGYLEIEKLKVKEIKIASSPEASRNDSTVGFGRIKSGETTATVTTSKIKANSLVFVTFMSDLAGRTYYIAEKDPGNTFKVRLSGLAPENLDFQWWVVDSDLDYEEFLEEQDKGSNGNNGGNGSNGVTGVQEPAAAEENGSNGIEEQNGSNGEKGNNGTGTTGDVIIEEATPSTP